MNCSKFRKDIFQYIDNELSVKDKKLFEEHLENCSECNEYFNEMRQACSSVKSIDETEPPSNMTDLIMNYVKNEKSNKKPARIKNLYFYRRIAAIAASFILVVIISVALNNNPSKNYLNSDGYTNLDNDMVLATENINFSSYPVTTSAPAASSAPAEAPKNNSTIEEKKFNVGEIESEGYKIKSMQLIFNKNILKTNDILKASESNNVDYEILNNNDIVTIEFNKETQENMDGYKDEINTKSDMRSLCLYIIANYKVKVYMADDKFDMDNNSIILVVN